MKMIVAFVQPSLSERIVRVIEGAGLFHLSICRVHGVVHPHKPIFRAELAPEGEAVVRLEAYCEDARVDRVMALICEVGRIGDLSAGAVFVMPVDQHQAIGPSLAVD